VVSFWVCWIFFRGLDLRCCVPDHTCCGAGVKKYFIYLLNQFRSSIDMGFHFFCLFSIDFFIVLFYQFLYFFIFHGCWTASLSWYILGCLLLPRGNLRPIVCQGEGVVRIFVHSPNKVARQRGDFLEQSRRAPAVISLCWPQVSREVPSPVCSGFGVDSMHDPCYLGRNMLVSSGLGSSSRRRFLFLCRFFASNAHSSLLYNKYLALCCSHRRYLI
jgi:hypothetical protein